MDRYSILDRGLATPATASTNSQSHAAAAAPKLAPVPVHSPRDDDGNSLSAMAERDLEAALQLLAERAQYITGASGAAIALREHGEMICRASAGPSAPALGATLQVNSGLSGESVRTRRTLRCDDAATDERVNRESCRVLGIASVVVMPLVREGEVNGVFELLSGRPCAFQERDLAALERLGEMIQTAVEHAEAARRAERELASGPQLAVASLTAAHSQPLLEPSFRVDDEPILLEMALAGSGLQPEHTEKEFIAEAKPAPADIQPAPVERSEASPLGERGNIRSCESCGFPVSEGRKLCLDCETQAGAPQFLSHLASSHQGWLRSHLYLIGAVLVAAATVALLVWYR